MPTQPSEPPRPPFRRSARGLLIDEHGAILLALHRVEGHRFWVPPGGGVRRGETDREALARELAEEVGLRLPADAEPPLVWRQWIEIPEMERHGFRGVHHLYFLIRGDRFDPAPGAEEAEPEDPYRDDILHLRWWPVAEITRATAAGSAVFTPRELGTLLAEGIAADTRLEIHGP